MWVVKVGGSLQGSVKLPGLLASLAQRNDVVVVPGGGRFADQVREEQAALGYDDATAHHKAVEAMEQYARVLCDCNPKLYPIKNISEINDPDRRSGTPVWFPVTLLKQQTDMPMNWQATSDTLGLWFADLLGAMGLILIKSVPNNTTNINELARAGYVDGYFPKMMRKTKIKRIISVCAEHLVCLQQTTDLAAHFPAETWLHI